MKIVIDIREDGGALVQVNNQEPVLYDTATYEQKRDVRRQFSIGSKESYFALWGESLNISLNKRHYGQPIGEKL